MLIAPTLCAAGALAAAPPAELTEDMAPLAFMVGSWTIREEEYDASGEVVERIEGGTIEIQPILRGAYLEMKADPPPEHPEVASLLWLFCADPSEDAIIARGMTSDEPGMMVASGDITDAALVLHAPHPAPQTGPLFRLTLEPVGADELEARIEVRSGEGWTLRTREWWTRRE